MYDPFELGYFDGYNGYPYENPFEEDPEAKEYKKGYDKGFVFWPVDLFDD